MIKGGIGMRRVCAALMAMMLLFTLGGCGDDGTGKGFRLPLDSEPRQLDPQTATDASSVTVIAALFEGLTRLNADGGVSEGAASYTLSADKRTYTFTLHESYWSTLAIRGEETPWDEPTRVVADDFLFGLQRAASPDNQSGTAAALNGIRNADAVHKGDMPLSALGVKVVNDHTLTISLDAPDEAFLSRLATTPFMPCNRAFFAYTAGRYGLEKQYILSNGAFSLTAWNHGQSILLNKNDRHHAAETVSPTAVRFLIDIEDTAAALQDGTLDAAFLTADKVTGAQQAGITVMSLADCVRGLYFNTTTTPLDNTDIRHALRDSIEWATVYEYLAATGEPKATGYIPPDAIVGTAIYRNGENAATYTTREKTAQAALGRGLKSAYPEEATPTMPSLTLLAAEDEVSANLARYIVQSWQKNLKLSCTLELVSDTTLSTRVNNGNYQLALYTAVGGGLTAADTLAAYTTGAGNNLTGYADAAFDAAYQAAVRGSRAQVTAAETYLRTACPVVPLSFPHRRYGIAAHTEGVTVRPFGGGTYGGAYEFIHAKKYED